MQNNSIASQDFTCENCNEEFSLNDGETPYQVEGEVLCDNCYRECHQTLCVICEDYFDTPVGDEPVHMFIRGYYGKLRPGIYLATSFPIWIDSLLGGEFHLFEENLKLVRPIRDETLQQSGDCCPDCAAAKSDVFREHTMCSGKKLYAHAYDSAGRLTGHWHYPANLLHKGDQIEAGDDEGEVVFRRHLPYISWADAGKYKGVGRKERTIIHLKMGKSGLIKRVYREDGYVPNVVMARKKPLNKIQFTSIVNLEE